MSFQFSVNGVKTDYTGPKLVDRQSYLKESAPGHEQLVVAVLINLSLQNILRNRSRLKQYTLKSL